MDRYEEDTSAIQELIQGIQSAEKLMLNLHSAQAREFFIPKILYSYHNAISLLKNAGQLPSPGSVTESSILVRSPGSEALMFDHPSLVQQGQNDLVSRKRKGSKIWEDQVRVCGDKELKGDTNDGAILRKYVPYLTYSWTNTLT